MDLEAAEQLLVSRADFMHALQHDVKPALGSAEELLEGFLTRGIVPWSPSISGILSDGELLLQQAASDSGPGLVSILLEVGWGTYKDLPSTFSVFLLRC